MLAEGRGAGEKGIRHEDQRSTHLGLYPTAHPRERLLSLPNNHPSFPPGFEYFEFGRLTPLAAQVLRWRRQEMTTQLCTAASITGPVTVMRRPESCRVRVRQRGEQGEDIKQSSRRRATLDAPAEKSSEEKLDEYGSARRENVESHPYQAVFTADAQEQNLIPYWETPIISGKFCVNLRQSGPPRGSATQMILS